MEGLSLARGPAVLAQVYEVEIDEAGFSGNFIAGRAGGRACAFADIPARRFSDRRPTPACWRTPQYRDSKIIAAEILQCRCSPPWRPARRRQRDTGEALVGGGNRHTQHTAPPR